jgi:hypothetical protein
MDNDEIVQWLLQGDPSIRWQTKRDLLNKKPAAYNADRQSITTTGWGAKLLAQQNENGLWANALYSPKWTSATYTMLLLKHLGLSPQNAQAHKTCAVFLERGFYSDGGINFFRSYHYSETCVTAMIFSLLCYFHFPDDRLHQIADHLLGQQMPDGGWNCEKPKGATHGSFHTTISVLESLHEYAATYPRRKNKIEDSIERAHEFLLLHRLYHSHRTGKIVDPEMTRIHFPPRWHYDFLRALDYFQVVNAPRDQRLSEAIELLRSKRLEDGRWKQGPNWTGKIFFDLEKVGQPGRWNTLRALRILKWWEK